MTGNKKKKLVVVIILFVLVFMVIPWIYLVNRVVEADEKAKQYYKDLQMKVKVQNIHYDEGMYVLCSKVLESNHKNFNVSDEKFFVEVNDTVSKIVLYQHKERMKFYYLEKGSVLIINENQNGKIRHIRKNGKDEGRLMAIRARPYKDEYRNLCW